MQCIQTLGRHNWRVEHQFLQPNVPPFQGFRAWFFAFWGGKRTRSWGIGTKALPDQYKHLIYNQCNVYKHFEVIIEVSLILFLQPNILLFWGFRAWFSAFWGGKHTSPCGISTKPLPAWYKHLIYTQCNLYKHLEVTIEVSHILVYILTFLCFVFSKLDFRHSGVVNWLVRCVLVPRLFLNDTNTLYITNKTYTNIWKS